MTYNIHRGLSAFRKINIRENLTRVLTQSGADIVCLQEVWTEYPALEPNLEDLTQAHWSYQAYGKNVVVHNGHQGNVILSRFPILKWKNLDLSVPGVEPRGCLFAEIDIPNQTKVAVFSQHLGLVERERTQQIERLNGYLESQIDTQCPLIVAGDFNDWRRKVSKSLKSRLGLVEAHRQWTGAYARTYPSIFPVFHLDRIYYRNLHLKNARVHSELPRKGLSDHLPLEATLEYETFSAEKATGKTPNTCMS